MESRGVFPSLFPSQNSLSLHIYGETKDAGWAEKENQGVMCAAW